MSWLSQDHDPMHSPVIWLFSKLCILRFLNDSTTKSIKIDKQRENLEIGWYENKRVSDNQ